jgi:hypothetical protein
MAFSVGSLADYTKENEALLVTNSVLGAKTAALIKSSGNVMVGVKSSEQINVMDTDAFFQAGGTCGFNASGTTSFTQRPVVIGKVKVNESLCPKALEAKYLQKALPTGSRYDSVPFEQEYSEKKASVIAAQLETAIWQGSLLSADGNLNKFKGFIRHSLEASASIIAANSATFISGGPVASITSANVIAVFDAVYLAIPAKVVAKDDMTIFCGQDLFRTYTIALKNSANFHYQIDAKADSEFILPATSIKVIAVAGLNGTNKIYACRLSNMFLGTDLLNEEEKFEIFYAKEADEVRFVCEFKMGVNFAFPDEWVEFKL